MKPAHLFIISLTFIGCFVACKKEPEPTVTSAVAQAYIDEVVGLMQKWSINRKIINWDTFKQKVNDKAQGAQSIADTYPAIKLALTLLGDNHSLYSYPNGKGYTPFTGERTLSCTDVTPSLFPSNPKIGYIKLPTTGQYDANGVKQGLIGLEYAQAIQDAIKQADSDAIQGWVIDLRGNLGGDMWAMLAGIGPILGEGLCGYFVNPDSTVYSPWSYSKGTAIYVSTPTYTLPTPYTLRKPNPKVAVLTNQKTVSSGEAVTIAFKGRANTRSFGNPTCGLSTANIGFDLSDRATLTLTVSTMVDRTKTVYGKAVLPDQTSGDASAVANATAWLLK